jgi:hypothetical protein
MKSLTLLILLVLTGCATCEEHPGACAAVVAVAATCVALSVDHDHARPHDIATPAVVCDGGACR